MKIELIKSWGYSAPGQVIDPPPGVAALLIERGIAKLADQPPFTDRWHKRQTQPPAPQRQEAQRGRK
jgi:hypothetical protein